MLLFFEKLCYTAYVPCRIMFKNNLNYYFFEVLT